MSKKGFLTCLRGREQQGLLGRQLGQLLEQQRLLQEQLVQQQERQQQVLELQVQRLLLFCRKRTKQQQR